MSTDQLKWHLLRKVTQMMVPKFLPQYRISDANFSRLETKILSTLTKLLLSGKEGATAVRTILSQKLIVHGMYFTCHGKLGDDEFRIDLHSDYLKNLALRWTRFLQVIAYFNQPYQVRVEDTEYDPQFLSTDPKRAPDWVLTLHVKNCIEKLHLKYAGELCLHIAVVKACRNLAILICTPGVLVSLLEYVQAPYFSKLDTIETTEWYDWSVIFEHMTKHPEQCPALETLEMHNNRFKLIDLSKSIHKYSIPTVKTLNIGTGMRCCTASDYNTLASICAAFPNLEKASLTMEANCEHQDPKFPVIVKSYGPFNPKIAFTLNYNLVHGFQFEELHRFVGLQEKIGPVTMICEDHFHFNYTVKTCYPNVTLYFAFEYQMYGLEVTTDYETYHNQREETDDDDSDD